MNEEINIVNIPVLMDRIAGREFNSETRPFVINDQTSVWYVKSGHLDLFSTVFDHDGNSLARQLIASVSAGNIIFPMVDLNSAQIVKIMQAIGNAEVKQLALGDFLRNFEPYPELLTTIVDGWLELISSRIAWNAFPAYVTHIKIGEDVTIEDGASLCPEAGGIAWCMIKSGTCVIPDNHHLRLLVPGTMIPMLRTYWLEATEDVTVMMKPTCEVIRLENWIERLYAWHHMIADMYELDRRCIIDEEVLRLQQRQRIEDNIQSNAASELASVLRTRKKISAKGRPPAMTPLEYAWRMLADYHKLPENDIRFPTELTPDMSLKSYARDSGFKIRKIILPDNWWKKDSGPIIAFLDDREKTPVVLMPRNSRKYDIVNAETLEVRTANASDATRLLPHGYVLYRQFPLRKLNLLDIVKFAVRGNRNNIIMTILMGVVGALIGLIIPACTGIVFGSVIPEAKYDQLIHFGTIIFAGAIAGALFQLTLSIAMIRMEMNADYHLQAAVIDRLLSLPIPFFRQFSVGDLSLRCQGISSIRTLLSDSAATVIIGGIFSSFYLFALFFYNMHMALLAISFSLGFAVILTGIAFMATKAINRVYELQGDISGFLIELFTGIEKIRLSGAENRAFGIFAGKLKETTGVSIKYNTFNSMQVTLNAIFPVITALVFFYWVGTPSRTMPIGAFIAFNAMYAAFLATIIPLSLSMISWTNIVPSYNRLRPIIEALPEMTETRIDPGRLTGALELNNVWFRYASAEEPVLRGINLSVKPGEFVAIVGSSGSGKSTLLKLLLGFEHPETGGVFYDGNSLDRLDVRKVRRQLGVVLQSGQLFYGSVYDNIVCDLDLPVEEAWRAATAAGCDRDIREMPLQMDTILSAGNDTISGGQKQRILIARSLIRNPRLIFFDEATSALDNQSQTIITQSLKNLNVARIVIAHRINTVMDADCIYVMHKGEFVEAGTYKELIEKDGMFARIAKRQVL